MTVMVQVLLAAGLPCTPATVTWAPVVRPAVLAVVTTRGAVLVQVPPLVQLPLAAGAPTRSKETPGLTLVTVQVPLAAELPMTPVMVTWETLLTSPVVLLVKIV